MTKLGKSQRAVLEYLRDISQATGAREIGAALYEKTSSCSHFTSTGSSIEKRATRWASKVLSSLKKLGLVKNMSYLWKTSN